MATVVISAFKVAKFLEGGGHFWVYMQYAHALRKLGCDVYWLEQQRSSGDEARDASRVAALADRLARFGLAGRLLMYRWSRKGAGGDPPEFLGVPASVAEGIIRRADLLLNFHYELHPDLLVRFRRTALVDIDPGLLQFWVSRGQRTIGPHDYYFTTGETVGTPNAPFPDCGLPWLHIRPPIALDLWDYRYDPHCRAFTTVSNWRGGDWLADGDRLVENTKGLAFLQFASLPRLTPQPLELALCLGNKDGEDRRYMASLGWRIRHAYEVASTPEAYQTYIRSSRGEFSCAKPSYVSFQTAWISDRTLCYLATGKPVVVQHTGPSAFLPNGEGMFRFTTLEEAAEALAAVNANYERHCRAARSIAEAYFDSRQVLQQILDTTLSSPGTVRPAASY
ncbi:MAG: hypothetical protein HY690_19695 [Chloroflexi bacterium]|nr:hypothetical protein [Chloroflexota bacterium]